MSATFASATVQGDCGTEEDVGDFPWLGHWIADGSRCEGGVSELDADVYIFDAYFGDTLHVEASRVGGGTARFCLLDPEGAAFICRTLSTISSTLAVSIPGPGQWALTFFSPTGSVSGYSFAFGLVVGVDEDCRTGGDAGDAFDTASRIRPPVSRCAPVAAVGDAADWYRFLARPGQPIDVLVDPSRFSAAEVCILAPDGAVRGCASAAAAEAVPLNLTADVEGEWRVRVVLDAPGRYELSVHVNVHEGEANDRPVIKLLQCAPVAPGDLKVRCFLIADDEDAELSATFVWGDDAVTVRFFGPGLPVFVPHTYATPGNYTVQVEVDDNQVGALPGAHESEPMRVVVEAGSATVDVQRMDETLVRGPSWRSLDPDRSLPTSAATVTHAAQMGEGWLPLAERLDGSERVTLAWSPAAVTDLDVQFLDSQYNDLPSACAREASDGLESCAPPPGARFAGVVARHGLGSSYSLRIVG